MEPHCPENTENDVEWMIIILENIILNNEVKCLQKKHVPIFVISAIKKFGQNLKIYSKTVNPETFESGVFLKKINSTKIIIKKLKLARF